MEALYCFLKGLSSSAGGWSVEGTCLSFSRFSFKDCLRTAGAGLLTFLDFCSAARNLISSRPRYFE